MHQPSFGTSGLGRDNDFTLNMEDLNSSGFSREGDHSREQERPAAGDPARGAAVEQPISSEWVRSRRESAQLETDGSQARTRRLIKAAVKLWELRRSIGRC